jgi:hypothetical protein
MFERYTENARRLIFFARYEASQFGSPSIEAEYLLLGLFREDPALLKSLVPKLAQENLRKQIEDHIPKRPQIATSVDLPLSEEAKQVLKHAAIEADELGDKHIGTEHMLLGLLREEKSFAAQLLQKCDAKLPELRAQIEKKSNRYLGSPNKLSLLAKTLRARAADTVEIRGSKWKADYVQSVVGRLREYSWHWQKCSWQPRDIVVARKGGAVSFDLSLAQDAENFELVKNGWKKDRCAICGWELFESAEDKAHGVGYTNGHEWLCTECHGKFFEGPDFFGSAYAEIT